MHEVFVSILVLGLTGLSFAVLLAFLSKKLAMKENVKVKKLFDALPGVNCGVCGFSGCRAFAEAAVKNNKIFAGCIPGGDTVNEKISRILGLSNPVSVNKQIAVCHCAAREADKKVSCQYQGPANCRAAGIAGRVIDCIWGCLGLGDCAAVCPVAAITIKEMKVEVDVDKCIGCGKCVEACPRNLFELVLINKNMPIYYVACSNKDRGVDVKKVCARGCIACGICVRLKDSPYILKNNLSRIDHAKLSSQEVLETARNKCPTKCIVNIDVKGNS